MITLLTKQGQKVSDSLVFQSLAYPIEPAVQLQEIRNYFQSLDTDMHRVAVHAFAHGTHDSHTGQSTRRLVPSRPLNSATQFMLANQAGQSVKGHGHHQQPQQQQQRIDYAVAEPQQQQLPMQQSFTSGTSSARGLVPARPLKINTTLNSPMQHMQSVDYNTFSPNSLLSSRTASGSVVGRIPVIPPRNLTYRPNIAISTAPIIASQTTAAAAAMQRHSSNPNFQIANNVADSSASPVVAHNPNGTATTTTMHQMPAFSSNTLLVKSRHIVDVVYIEDGPSLFSIQLKAHEHDLDQMQHELANYPLQNLRSKPSLGQACVVRYAEDSNMYRAVIMSIRPTACLVAYVDYGHTGNVSFADIYEIPVEFLRHQIFAMRFTLAGYQQLLPLSREVDRLFQALVRDEERLELVVRPLDGPPCVQYCELYVQGGRVNVIERLLALQHARRHYAAAVMLREQELVIIRCIESAKHFYVQPVRHLDAYEQMLVALQAYGRQTAARATHAPMRVGEPCMVWHQLNREWNRAEVVEVRERTAVGGVETAGDPAVVRFVDLGSVNAASEAELLQLPSEFLALPRQAVLCCLESFADVQTVSPLTVNQMEMLADREDGQPRAFKVSLCGTLLDSDDKEAAAKVVNLIDASVKPILDLSQRVFMMCMPQTQFRAYEQQRYRKLAAAAAAGGSGGVGGGALVKTPPKNTVPEIAAPSAVKEPNWRLAGQRQQAEQEEQQLQQLPAENDAGAVDKNSWRQLHLQQQQAQEELKQTATNQMQEQPTATSQTSRQQQQIVSSGAQPKTGGQPSQQKRYVDDFQELCF